MSSIVMAATFTTAMLVVPALVTAQEGESAQAKQARPCAGAATRTDQSDSGRTVSQAERRRPPAATVEAKSDAPAIEAKSSGDQGTSNAERRRPPSSGSSGNGTSAGSVSDSSGSWNRAVPRRSSPYPSHPVYYPGHRYYSGYYPWGYPGFGFGYFYYAPWGFFPGYWGPGYYGYGPYMASGYAMGAVKLKVTPRAAEVLVDGYYAGTVDDFDGVFQALRLDSGAYKIEIRKPGYETLHFDVRVQPDRTITYRGDMKPTP
jgi:hypothetical protein